MMHITASTRFQYGNGPPCHGIDYRLQLGRVRGYSIEADSLVFLDGEGKTIAWLARKK